MAELPAKATAARINRNKGVDMYITKTVNGVPAVERRPSVLNFRDENRGSSNWRWVLVDHKPALLLNEHDREWLKAIDEADARKVHHA